MYNTGSSADQGETPERTAFFSLGDFCDPEDAYESKRQSLRETFGFAPQDVVIAHSGKFTKRKKTLELIEMVIQLQKQYPNVKLLLIGGVQDPQIAEAFEKLTTEHADTVRYVGWQSGVQLRQYLIAADIYLQFSPSSTYQTALCCRCVGITGDPDNAYIYYPEKLANRVETLEQMAQKIKTILDTNDIQLHVLQSYALAQQLLDYRYQIKNKLGIDER